MIMSLGQGDVHANGQSDAHLSPIESQHVQSQAMLHEVQLEKKVDHARLLELGRELLIALGENPDREGLQETPRRWADWWREFIEYHPGTTETTFQATATDQLVAISGMRVFSLCEHHLLPMWCEVSIGYLPAGKVLGLSKFARIAHQFAHQLQIQERLGELIADEIGRITESQDRRGAQRRTSLYVCTWHSHSGSDDVLCHAWLFPRRERSTEGILADDSRYSKFLIILSLFIIYGRVALAPF